MKNLFLAILSGILLAISWPTYGFPIFIFVAFVPLLIAENTIRLKENFSKTKVFFCAYITFLIWNLITTSWLYYADIFGMLFANLVNSLLMSLVFLLYHISAKRFSKIMSLSFLIVTWISFEKLHLHWDFSWPWLNLGNVFSEFTNWVQWYEFTGTFGGTLWILVVNSIIFYSMDFTKSLISNVKNILPKAALLIGIPIIISLWIYNSYNISGNQKEVVLLQPNIDPYTEKYLYTNNSITDLLLKLTNTVKTSNTEFVIAPETVYAENLTYNRFLYSDVISKLKFYISENPKAQFLFGLDTYDLFTDESQKTIYSNQLRDNLWGNFYNKAVFLNQEYEPQTYLKSKLVVGIENFPFKPILEPILGNIMLDLGGTISTKTIQNVRTVFIANDSTKVAPIICYESVYGDYVTDYVKNGAEFLAIITNDAWWQETQGHKQHLSLAKLRAIETRKDVARSANTGISAFINQKGDVISQTKYNEQIALLGKVTLNDKQTFYVKFGDYIANIALVVFIILFILLFIKTKK